MENPSSATSATENAPTTKDSLRETIAQHLGLEPEAMPADDADLIDSGLDSITMMRLASLWGRAGVDLSFSDLNEQPTVEGWWALMESRRAPGNS